ncbi:DUF6415 family natural product biosynthesis protein [Streptomyces sp. NPDC002611]
MTAPATDLALSADTVAMRTVAHSLLARDGRTPADEELPALIRRLREHIELLAPAVEALIRPLPMDEVPRGCAIYRVGEARLRLRAQARLMHSGGLGYAQGLARSLQFLCNHYESLRDQRVAVQREDQELAAYVRMLYHPHGCRACRPSALTECRVAERLYEEWRRARRGANAVAAAALDRG